MKLTISFYIFLCSILQCKGLSQDWGYVTVRPKAHMFWWLYYSPESMNVVKNQYEKSLLIWLQGGPGESSTGIGNFVLIGPEDMNSQPRQYSWVNEHNVLFIDSPVGAGFSFTENEFAFSTTNTNIAEDLFKCIEEFLKMKPEFTHVPIYIAGESYGGKMAIEFANLWYKKQINGLINSNLRGVLLENPWISPTKIISSYGSLLYNLGIVDKKGQEIVQKYVKDIQWNMDNNRWLEATNAWLNMKRRILNLTNNFDFNNILNVMQPYNYSYHENCMLEYRLNNFMNGPIKRKLDINCTIWGSQKGQVQFFLYEDYMKSVFTQVQDALENTMLTVYIYTGQLGVTVDISGTLEWIEMLKWNNKNNWNEIERQPLIINGIIEGYFKKYDRFAMYWINRSGHMVARDNPAAVLQVLRDLTNHN